MKRRRALVAGVGLLVLAAGCRTGDPSTIELGPAATTTTTFGAAAAPGTPAPSAPTATPAPRRQIIVGGTDAVRSAPPASSPGSGGPGTAAGWFLRPRESTRIVVQVLTQRGAEPASATVARVVDVLRSASGKPVTTAGGTVSGGRDIWTSTQLRDAADASPGPAAAGTAVLRLLFVHGRSDKGDDVLGISARGDVAAVFSDQVASSGTGLVSTDTIERAVTTHEVGHLLGLVDLFLATGRADKDHPGHSTNRGSVMYWAVESTLVGDLLGGGPPQNFDAADLADLATIRGG
jgi:hypothetical protein